MNDVQLTCCVSAFFHQPGNFEKNLQLVDKLQEIAKQKGLTPTQLCLAWEIAQSDVSAIDGSGVPGQVYRK